MIAKRKYHLAPAMTLLMLLLATPAWAVPGETTEGTPEAEKSPTKSITDDEYYELFQLFVDSMDQIERNYVKPIDRRELVEAAIEGMLDELDPYSSYIPPEELASFRTNVESTFGGIGLQVTIEGGKLTVVSPLVGSPAYRAGIIAGDVITQIDDEPTDGLALDRAIKKLKGKVDSKVTLTVRHQESEELESYAVVREIVRVDTVLGDRRDEEDAWQFMFDEEHKIGYIRITAFGRETAKDLRSVLNRLEQDEVRGLILDLRFNPGGLLTSAIEISDLFVSKGKIVSTSGRNAPRRSWQAHEKQTVPDWPLVVLVNRYSASASEIVAACLQDNNRALIVGDRTWGKGSVQNVIELEGGKSILKLTTASYQRPNGHNIHRFAEAKTTDEWGVMPDDGYRITLGKMELGQLLRDRRRRDIVLPHGESKTNGATAQAVDLPPEGAADAEPFVDRQLEKGLAYLRYELTSKK